MVTFRLVKIPIDDHEVCGFVLCFDDATEPNTFFKILESSYATKAPNKIYVDFSSKDHDFYTLHITVDGKDQTYNVDIIGVEKHYVSDLIKSLKNFGYVYILTAFTGNDNVELNRGSYATFSECVIDGKLISGNGAKFSFPYKQIKDTIS